MNALGKATVGLTVLGGEYLVPMGTGSSDAEFGTSVSLVPLVYLGSFSSDVQAGLTANIVPLWRLPSWSIGLQAGASAELLATYYFEPSVQMTFGTECEIVSIHGLQPAVTLVAGVTFERLIPFVWDAAILIDFADEVTYPLIVVNEAVEPTPTNTISIPTF